MDWDPRYFSEIISMTTKKWNISLGNIATNEWNAEQDRGRSVAEANAFALFLSIQNGKKRYWRIMKTGTSCCVQTFQKT